MTVPKRYFIIPLIIALAYACNKGYDGPVAAAPTARLNMINAVTDVKAIDFYLNGTRQNNSSAIYINGTSGYITVPISEQQYQVKEDTTRLQIANITLALPKESVDYSLLVTGQKAGGNITSILMPDADNTTGNANMARVRFVQGIPSATYDVFVGDTLSFKNQTFKTVSSFLNTGPGKKVLKVKRVGDTTTIYRATLTLLGGNYYTLFTEGVANGTGVNAPAAALVITR